MNKKLLVFLPFLLMLAGVFASCEEVEEEGAYANWRERNQAFIDSIRVVAGDNLVMNLEQLEKIQPGEMFYIKNDLISTEKSPQYVYCKKLVKNMDGERPLYFESAYVYYYGTLYTGSRFDGSFTGYSSLDQNIPIPPAKEPTEFDWTVKFSLPSLTSGWRTALQYMHTGERWMLYVPWESAYGTSDAGSVPGYSVLTFDVIMTEVVQ